MDYKKLLAATAVTSAAFVVPTVVGAEEIVPVQKDGLIAEGTYSVGNTVKAAVSEFTESSTGDGTTDKIVSYEWFIGDSKTASAQTAEFKLPILAEGKEVKLVVTTEGKKKYFQTILVNELPKVDANFEIDGENKSARINTTITMKDLNISTTVPDEVISDYEWYLVDRNQYKLLVGENDVSLDIPIEFSGKELLFVVKTEAGNAYKKSIKIDQLDVDLSTVEYSVKANGKLVDNLMTYEFLPGDQVEVSHSEIKGNGDQLLNAEDYEVHYKWVAFNGNNYFSLPNATGNTFTIPVDSKKQGYTKFKVAVTISVPAIPVDDTKFIEFELEIDNGNDSGTITGLIKAIDDLDDIQKYSDLQAEVDLLLEKYNSLNESAKSAISNYSKLTEHVQVLQVVKPIIDEFNKLHKDYTDFLDVEETTVKQVDLLKRVNLLRQKFNNLTAKQKKIYNYFEVEHGHPSIAQLHDWVVKIGQDEDAYKTNAAIVAFNNKVTDNVYGAMGQSYVIEFDDNDLVVLAAFETIIKQYIDEAKSIDKAYQSLLKTNVLKTALADVKKARAVIEKINKINTLTGKKKASAIIAAEKAYNKLNSAQASLISKETMEKLEEPYTDEELEDATNNGNTEAIVALIDRIAAILPTGDSGKSYSLEIEYLELELAGIAVDYKLLPSPQKKLVTNYKSVSQVKKDVAAAKRVAIAIKKAEEAKAVADEYVNDEKRSNYISKMKSAQSKYNAAYKAYVKLTTEQKSLVDGVALTSGMDEIILIIDNEEFAGKDEYDSNESSKVVGIIEGINTLLNTAESTALANNGGFDSDTDLQQEINKAKSEYKDLKSFEKKLVHNYALVSTASSHLSKAASVKKRLLAVTDKKKFASAKSSFDKLQPVQQGLIIGTYEEVNGKYGFEESSSLQDLDDQLTQYFESGTYDFDVFKDIQNELQFVSSKELKTLKNYSQYQEMVKNMKTVDSFVAKMVKLGENPTYSQKESIYKSYLKLTQVQQKLFSSYSLVDGASNYEEMLTSWMDEANGKAADLNQRINDIISNGQYKDSLSGTTALESLAAFEQLLKDLNNEYKALDSKERKLVANYSYIKDAEKDLKVVRTVIQLEEELKIAEESNKPSIESKLTGAKEKLTYEQQSLYEIVTP
ncbi:MAG: hypothetical protein RR642_05685 [Solibacillus sp.]